MTAVQRHAALKRLGRVRRPPPVCPNTANKSAAGQLVFPPSISRRQGHIFPPSDLMQEFHVNENLPPFQISCAPFGSRICEKKNNPKASTRPLFSRDSSGNRSPRPPVKLPPLYDFSRKYSPSVSHKNLNLNTSVKSCVGERWGVGG